MFRKLSIKMQALYLCLMAALITMVTALPASATPADLEDIVSALSPTTVIAALLALAGIVYGVLWVINGIRKCTKFLNRS